MVASFGVLGIYAAGSITVERCGVNLMGGSLG
jgi:hypothetical protein